MSVMTLYAAGASSISKPEGAVRRMEEPQRADAISGCISSSATPLTFFTHRGTNHTRHHGGFLRGKNRAILASTFARG